MYTTCACMQTPCDKAHQVPIQKRRFKAMLHINQTPSKARPIFGLGQDNMASVATLYVPSKRSFLLATVNQAPSLALRRSNMVSYLHGEKPQ